MNKVDRDKIRDQFGALLDGELLPEQREAVESALAQDAELLRELDALKRVDDLYRAMPAVYAPQGFEHGVRDRLRPRVLWFGQRRHKTRRVWPTALAAALFLFTSGYVIVRMQQSSSDLRIASLPKPQMEGSLQSIQPETTQEPAPDPLSETADKTDSPPFEAQLRSLGYVASTRHEAPSADDQPVEALHVDDAQASKSVEEPRVELDKMVETPQDEAGVTEMSESEQDIRRDVQSVDGSRSGPATAGAAEPADRAMAPLAPPPPATPPPATALEAVAPADPSPTSTSNGAARKAGPEFMTVTPSDLEARGIHQEIKASGPAAVLFEQETIKSKTIGPRTFVLVENTWYEIGYAKEAVVSIQRGSDALKALMKSDKGLKKILELKERVVFKSGGRWYEMAAEGERDSTP